MMLQRLKSLVIPMAYSLPADKISAGVAPVAAPAAPLRLSAGDRPSAIARQAITEFGGRPAPSTRRPPKSVEMSGADGGELTLAELVLDSYELEKTPMRQVVARSLASGQCPLGSESD